MTNFPYIKWWQTSVHVVIEFLHKSENSIAEKKDNILIFKDNKYDLELDLLNDFKVDGIITNPKTTKLLLFKLDDLKWTKLLKNETKYKYYISTDWDKFLDDELEDDNNNNIDDLGFDPSKLSREQFDNLMRSMPNNEIIVPDFDSAPNNNEVDEVDEVDETDEDSPLNVDTFDLGENIDKTIENSITNLDN